MNNQQYVLHLGVNSTLSRAELRHKCQELLYTPIHNLLFVRDLQHSNHRNLPKTPEQLYLDQLGGVVRMSCYVTQIPEFADIAKTIISILLKEKPTGKIQFGISGYGLPTKKIANLLYEIKQNLQKEYQRNARIVNIDGIPLTSGKIFGEKLLKKGFEFVIWKEPTSDYLIARTVANQNLRNYTLRDREKPFRDSKMGMLPPKLAQILINLANPEISDIIWDPFCGSGTINIEAGILGQRTIGSDINLNFVTKAQENFNFMAEKFRFADTQGKFMDSSVMDFPRSCFAEKSTGVIITEGYLGENFEQRPTEAQIIENSNKVIDLWINFFTYLQTEKFPIKTIVFCLPCWNIQLPEDKNENNKKSFQTKNKVSNNKNYEKISISQKLFAKIKTLSYTVCKLNEKSQTLIYERDLAFVGREICVVEKNDL